MDRGDKTLRAAVRLRLAEGVGAVIFHRLCQTFGGPEGVGRASAGMLRRVRGVGEKLAASVKAVTEADVDAELDAAHRLGAEIIPCTSPDYPRGLTYLEDRPPVLYVRGRLVQADLLAVGVVGSRRCTQYGMEQSSRFAGLLARAGMCIISGGARGIDTAAHRSALSAGGRTIAVMGCGLAHTYPRENRKLFERIVAEDRGALVSELPVHTAVMAGNFPTRNRIISGLSLGILVVEAARRSGALITARDAAEQGKPLLAVPGPVSSSMSQGTNELIRNHGATLVQGLDDVLEELGDAGEAVAAMAGESSADDDHGAEPSIPKGLTDLEAQLLSAMDGREVGLDDLVRAVGVDTGRVASAMTMLAIKGAVGQRPGNVFVRKR